MSLFDRYDQNEAELFLRSTCFIPTPQRPFEDLFEQIHQHFQQLQIFPPNDDSMPLKETNSPSESSKSSNEVQSDQHVFADMLMIASNSSATMTKALIDSIDMRKP